MKKILPTIILMTLFSCSKTDEPIIIPPSTENYILDFRFSMNDIMLPGTIDSPSETIFFNTVNTKLDNLIPIITISAKSSITPKTGIAQDFSKPVTYKVTSEDGSVRTYQVLVNNKNINEENQLLSFSLPINGENKAGIIDEETKVITFSLAGAELTNLKPNIEISEFATISPVPDAPQDFTKEVSYTIIASDGTPAIYRILVNNRSLRSDNEITFFSVSNGGITSEARINRQDGMISFDFGDLDRTNLIPTIEISEYASISPSLDLPQDFTNPVTYTVTAEDGQQFEYKVIANLPEVENIGGRSLPAKFFVGAELFITGKFLDLSTPSAQIYLFDGINQFPITVESTSNYKVSETNLFTTFNIFATIPVDTPTFESYQVVYEANGIKVVSTLTADIKMENPPNPISVDKNQYRYNDELIMTGENLTVYIAIPAPNGSIYLMDPRGSDITINANATEMRVVLDIRELFPSYYGDAEGLRQILILDQERRRGRSIEANFF